MPNKNQACSVKKSKLKKRQLYKPCKQCFGSGFIFYGSGSGSELEVESGSVIRLGVESGFGSRSRLEVKS